MGHRRRTVSALLALIGTILFIAGLRSAGAASFDGFDYPFGNKSNRDGWNANGNGFKNRYCNGGCGFCYHPGEDWNIDTGDDAGRPIYAAGAGLVKKTGTFGGGRGQYVVIRHDTPRGLRYTVYVHLQSVRVARGDEVGRGQHIADIFRSTAFGPHLHLEMRSSMLSDGEGDPYPNDDDCGYYQSPATVDANGFLNPTVEIEAQRPGTPEPSVDFYDTNGKNKWTNDPDRVVVRWTVSNKDVWGQAWDDDPGQQFTSNEGNLIFRYIEDENTRQGWHSARVRAWKGGKYWDFSSQPYGFDSRAPTATRTAGPEPGILATPARIDWNIDDPHSGLEGWGQAWDQDPGQMFDTNEGWLMTPEGTHTLYVHTWDNLGNNQNWNLGTWTVLPGAPSGLTAKAVTHTQIDLAWKDNSSTETSFEVERKTGAGSFTLVAALGSNQTSYEDKGVQPETTYTYHVRARTDKGASGWSNEATATTPPLPCSIIVRSPNGAESWDAGSTQNITWSSSGVSGDVKIELSRDTGLSWTTILASTANDGSESWVAGPASATARIRVSAVNKPECNDVSDADFVIVDPCSVRVTSPNGGETWVIASSVDITWDTRNAGSSIRVEISADDGSSWAVIAEGTPNDGTHTWSVTGPATSQGRVRVVSLDEPGCEDASDASFTVQVGAPVTPGGLRASAPACGEVQLSWTDNSDNEDGFTIERRTGTGAFGPLPTTVGANVRSYKDTNLRASTDYTYRVYAFNAGGNSGYSNQATAKTLPELMGFATSGTVKGGRKLNVMLSLTGPTPRAINVPINSSDTRLIPATSVLIAAGSSSGAGKLQTRRPPRKKVQVMLSATYCVTVSRPVWVKK